VGSVTADHRSSVAVGAAVPVPHAVRSWTVAAHDARLIERRVRSGTDRIQVAEGRFVDLGTQLLLLAVAIVVLVVAIALIRRRQRMTNEAALRESPFAVSTEGEKLCPNCGMGNLWTSRNCIACKARLPG
jgi:hypothetical protein